MKSTLTKKIAVPTLGVLMLLGGAAASYAGFASADTGSTTMTTDTTTTQPAFDIHKGGHVGKNGTKEELLTGDTAAKVTAAALAAEPDATIDRVETDAEGAAYEAHITKTDGSHVTLKFDENYTVTATETGPQGPAHN